MADETTDGPTEPRRVPKSPIQAIDRAVALLDAVATAGPRGVSLKHLTNRVGLFPSTGRTLLSALATHGLVDQDDASRRYILGSRMMEFTHTYLAQADLSAVAAPIIRRLWLDTEETVHLSVLQGARRVDVSVLVSPQLLNVNPTSARFVDDGQASLFRTAAGKVLLAGLDDAGVRAVLSAPTYAGRPSPVPLTDVLEIAASVRTAGWAINVEEEMAGVCGVAAPVTDGRGATVAALCIGYPAVRRFDGHADTLHAAVVAAAGEISGLLGATPLTGAPARTTVTIGDDRASD